MKNIFAAYIKNLFYEKDNLKIIASLTTTPSRINLIKDTLYSILNQTINIHSVEINIPYIFEKTGEKYIIPDWLLKLEKTSKVKIFRTEDYGSITKVAPTLIRYKNNKNTLVWSVDDDFIYPVNMLAVLFREYIPDNNYILSHSGGQWVYNIDSPDFCERYVTHRREGFIDFLEGFATVLYPAFLIEEDFESYVIKTSKCFENRNSDDILISNYFKLKGIKIYNCAYPYKKEHKLLGEFGLDYGNDKNALHKQDGGHQKRYVRVFNWLKEQNLNGWIKNLNQIE